MQASVVNYKELNFELRIDAEYHKAEVLDNLHMLDKKNNDVLENLASFVIGPFGSTVKVDQYVTKSDYRYIRNKDINDFVVCDDEPALIPEQVYENLSQFHIKESNLLITVVGTLGKVAIAQKKDAKSIFSCKSTLIRARSIDPFYLLAYLNSKIGQIFVLRGARGAIQQGLNLSDLKEIKVFIPSNSFQKRIRDIIHESLKRINKANNCYCRAEQILLSELDLLNWKPKHRLSFVKNSSDAQSVNRIDAEYFQPMYEEMVKSITSSKSYSCLGDLVLVEKCIEPGSEAYQEKGVLFLRVSNLSKFGFRDGNQQYLTEELYGTLKQHQPKKGEILLSKDATPGIAYYLANEPEEMIPSSGILRLRVSDEDTLCSEYLTLVLNSVTVQKQIERDAGGSIINHWLVDQVKSTLIPILPTAKQKKIAETVNQSFCSRELSKRLLGIAKRGVELTIEKDEKIAQEWITEKLKSLGINLMVNSERSKSGQRLLLLTD